MSYNDYQFPNDRIYWINETPSHLWLQKTNENRIKIGFTDFFQQRIGELNSITLKAKIGSSYEGGKTLGLIKAKNYSAVIKYPLSGKVVLINDKIIKKPSNVNKSPYESWLLELNLDDSLDDQITEKFKSPGEELESFIKLELKNGALRADECCPDILSGSGVVRRRKKTKKKGNH